MRHNAKWFALFLIMVLIAGCGGGGGGGGTTGYGGVSGYVYFDSTPASAKVPSQNVPLKNNLPTVPLYRGPAFQEKIVPNEKIIKFKQHLSASQITQIVANIGGTIKRKIYGTENTYVIGINTQNISIQSLNSNPNIEYTEDNQINYITDIPNDPGYAAYQTWNYEMLRMPQAWDITHGSNSIIVAVIDTGVASSHPDLALNLVAGYDFIDNDVTPDDATYFDEAHRYSHGTHVAGTIGAVTNNAAGVAGIAWNVKIMPIRVLGNDGIGLTSNITAGINWAVAHGAHIINLSLSGRYLASAASVTYKAAIDNALAQGITVVAAAGNNNDYVGFPANYAPVIAVAALGPGPLRASYSNYGPEISVSAPGGDGTNDIRSTSYDKLNGTNTYIGTNGTSMACPHISGLVALLYAKGITNPETVRQRLQTFAVDLGAVGKDDYYGYGLPRADDVLNGAVPDIRFVKVFWGNIDGTVLGTPINPNGSGYYSLSNIPNGQRYICAFLDRDMDGLVDPADKFAYISVTIQANTTLPNIDITVLQQASVTTPVPLAQYFKNLVNAK